MTNDEIVKVLRDYFDGKELRRGTALNAADLIESLQKQLIDYYHMGKVVDGQQNQNARLRKIVDKLTARAEKAEAERDTYRAALEALHMPTIDAVEVVRCRDCIHFGECLVTENDYCSKGERKENE